jgi:hypothetical protein
MSSLDETDDQGRTEHERIGAPAAQEDDCVRTATLSAVLEALPQESATSSLSR